MLTPLWEGLYDIILNSLHMFTIPINTFLKSPKGDLKNANISMEVSFFFFFFFLKSDITEKQLDTLKLYHKGTPIKKKKNIFTKHPVYRIFSRIMSPLLASCYTKHILSGTVHTFTVITPADKSVMGE